MEEYNYKTSNTPFSSSSSSRVSPLLSGSAVQGPCGACKVLRRRCTKSCLLAPYFPPTEPMKFINAHKIYGASNIVKCLQELPESKRADAVSSMVYEANARIRDPVYGCAGAISHLLKRLNDVQAELAMTQAEILIMQSQQQQQQQQQQQNDNAIQGLHTKSDFPDIAIPLLVIEETASKKVAIAGLCLIELTDL
uniref:LOB domain-containing protein n=1 Tax=Vitis vinifera TaxID=29760 RepID=F6HNJ1_VITVI